jgi:TRAP-type uncharacterized transport system substrate-binding protein
MSVQLNEKVGSALLSTTLVDMKTAQANAIYVVPTGKVLRITAIMVRDATASLSGGTSYSVTNWRQTFSLTGLTGVGTGYYYIFGADLTLYTETAAGVTINFTVTTGSTAAANATIDLFGVLTDA